jgi:hypothetical protein
VQGRRAPIDLQKAMRGDGVFGSQKAVMQLGIEARRSRRSPVRESSFDVVFTHP